jgi:predicted RNA-binding Zn ribbon-like protein
MPPIEEPGERAPAPEPVRLVQRFVNTVDLEGGPEGLSDAAALRDWLTGAGLLDRGARVTPTDHGRAIELREALRALAYANGGHPLAAGALEIVNEAARRAGLRPLLTGPATGSLVPASGGVDGALGHLLVLIADAQRDGTWSRLKACPAEDCQFAFYDRSRNRSAVWCDMKVCGNRQKVRSFRARHA